MSKFYKRKFSILLSQQIKLKYTTFNLCYFLKLVVSLYIIYWVLSLDTITKKKHISRHIKMYKYIVYIIYNVLKWKIKKVITNHKRYTICICVQTWKNALNAIWNATPVTTSPSGGIKTVTKKYLKNYWKYSK